MTNVHAQTRPARPPLSEPVDVLLADVAIRIQLSPTNYRKAEERYQTLGGWIDRPGSPLEDRVQLVYPQGSMAIGASIASRMTTDEYDVDFVAQLDLPYSASPARVLDLLFESIRGERGSQYFGMTERQTRCVTVNYADKMHADITPMIRIQGSPERASYLFHSPPRERNEPSLTLIANPYGFAEWFKRVTPLDHDFARVFEKRSYDYQQMLLEKRAESDEMPDQQPVNRKSKAVIVHQLMKRWRNKRYDKRSNRRPPSVFMAKLIADAANSTSTLSGELLHQADAMLRAIRQWHDAGLLIQVVNPACPEDVLTDRWPGSRREQAEFINDLQDLVTKVERLVAGCSLSDMQVIMADLFGEIPTQQAFRAFNEQAGAAIRDGRSQYSPQGGHLNLPASGLVGGIAAPSIVRAAPRHTFFGTERWRR